MIGEARGDESAGPAETGPVDLAREAPREEVSIGAASKGLLVRQAVRYSRRMVSSEIPSRPPGPFALAAIGWVRSPYQRRFGTPQQASAIDSDVEAVLELDPARIPADALADLIGMERIWVLSWLDRGGNWSARVRPPRGVRSRRSVFATRSPDRPNPIGLSAVQLLSVEGCQLLVRGIDLLDGTPILDIKPYVPYADAFPESKAGWIDSIPKDEPQFARRPPPPRRPE